MHTKILQEFYINIREISGLMVILFYCVSCSSSDRKSGTVTPEQREQEQRIVQKHCGNCHQTTPPDWLDRETWVNHVLPAMAPKLGIGRWRQNQYYPMGSRAIDFKEWITIVNYFKREAPEVLPDSTPPVPLESDWSIFSLQKPELSDALPEKASTTMIKIDSLTGDLYYSNATKNALIRWNAKSRHQKKLLFLQTPGVELHFLDRNRSERKAVVTTLGTMLAEDISRGVVQKITIREDTAQIEEIIADNLTRPLKTFRTDFNKDGRDDWIICVFGHDTGGLYLYQQETDNTYLRKPIWEIPGAEDVLVRDFNNDGWPDLMTLFAYGNEGIWLFLNDQEGGFAQQNLLQFPPVFGATSFQWVDVDEDGLQDIVLTNGDNADFSRILKPYHGLRIYLNEGNFTFREAYFYPMHGTTKAITRDFDMDGDQDIATISFFADFKNSPEQAFVYFEQTDRLEFKPYAVPIHQEGRWLVMDAGDVDGDRDVDLALGNFARRFMGGLQYEPTWNMQSPFIILRNESNSRLHRHELRITNPQ